MPKLIYLAGPYRAKTAIAVECNIRQAELALIELSQHGVFCLCPHTMTRFLDGTCTDEFWLDCTMELMRRCDAVYTFNPLARSSGTDAEVCEAMRLEMPVFETMAEVLEYAEGKS